MTFIFRTYQQELKLLLAAVALLMAAPVNAGNGQTWGCSYNSKSPMLVNIAWVSGAFSVRWQDGVANTYRYANAPGTVIDSLGGEWRYSFWDAHLTLENMVNGNVIACTS